MSASKILSAIPIDEVLELVDALLDEGADQDEAIDDVVKFVDSLVDFSTIAPGPTGAALELIDAPVLRAAIGLVLAFASDPEKREARKRKREQRREDRVARREARRNK